MADDEIVSDLSEEEIEIIDKANELSSRIDAKLRALSPRSPAGKIFKVHPLLRNVNAKAYEPHILAIGPYHRGENQLIAMEEQKLRYLKQLLVRKRENNTNKYVSVMWKLKEEARACYIDFVDLRDDEFVEMMLLDACFIVELFRKETGTIGPETGDPILKGGWISSNVASDLLLVENQLPFFVLQKFFDMTQMSYEESLCYMIFQVFDGFKSLTAGLELKDESYYIQSAGHLLGLLHWNWTHHSVKDSEDAKEENNRGFIRSKLGSCIRVSEVIGENFHLPSKRESGNVKHENNRRFICCWFHSSSQMDNNWASKIHDWIRKWFCLCSKIRRGNLTAEHDGRNSIGCATQLKEAGIKFKKVDGDSLLAVNFQNGIMEIPTLTIDDRMESFFRNLICL